jgi:predicted MFS family arabinose efflux permease
MFGVFLFMTYYLQVVQGYSAIKTGFAFLPMVTGFVVGSTQIGARLVNRLPARALMAPGFGVAAVAMLLLTRLEVGASYPGVVLPGLVLLGLGMGTAFMPAMSLATSGVQPRDAGVASAMVNTSQQVGGAIGTALLNTIAASATTTWVAAHHAAAGPGAAELFQARSLVHGYTTAIWVAVGIEAAAALIALFAVNAPRPGSVRVASSEDAKALHGRPDPARSADDEAQVPVVLH